MQLHYKTLLFPLAFTLVFSVLQYGCDSYDYINDGVYNAYDLKGTWRVDWEESTCQFAIFKITRGGESAYFEITPVDEDTITLRYEDSEYEATYHLEVTPEEDLQFSKESTVTIPNIMCNGEYPEMTTEKIYTFQEDCACGFVITNWSVGENTSCIPCYASSQSYMEKISDSKILDSSEGVERTLSSDELTGSDPLTWTADGDVIEVDIDGM